MEPTDPSRDPIVAVTSEDERFDAVLERAIALAASRDRQLILYDWDSPSLFAEPLPTWWSSEGTAEAVPTRLDPEQLDAAGRSAIAGHVRAARSRGVPAFGWLPSDLGVEALTTYAREQGATTLVVPGLLREVQEEPDLAVVLV